MSNKLREKLDRKYQSAKEDYQKIAGLRVAAQVALETIPEEFFEQALDNGYGVFVMWNGMEFDVKFPFTKDIIRETYKIIRKAGWKKKSTYDWEASFEITFELPGTDFTLEAQYQLNNELATCVKVPTKVKKIQTERIDTLEYEIYCSDDHPDLFDEDSEGNLIYTGENNPVIVEE